MTHLVQLPIGADDDAYEAEIYMSLVALECGEDVKFNGATIDLRHPKLPHMQWKARGFVLKPIRDERALWVEWTSFDFDSPSSFTPERTGMTSPRVKLFSGDHLTISDTTFWEVKDPSLSAIDKPRATANLLVRRSSGQIEKPTEPITFTHPLILETDLGIAQPNYWTMSHRLQELKNELFRAPGKYGSRASNAIKIADELFQKLRDRDWEIYLGRDATENVENLKLKLVSARRSTHTAAAFGYALAQAEAELTSRLEVRTARMKKSDGGKARAAQLQSRANDWKIPALEIAKSLDRSAHKFTRDALTTEILIKLYDKMEPPSAATVNAWLRNEVEPKGLIRSRARKPKSAKLTS